MNSLRSEIAVSLVVLNLFPRAPSLIAFNEFNERTLNDWGTRGLVAVGVTY